MPERYKILLLNWSYLGWSDIQARYRRSSLGVFWITCTTFVSSLAIAYVYSAIFNVKYVEYLPYITLGICFWNFVASSINEITSSLLQNRQLLLGRKIDPCWIWYRLIVRNMIVLAHSLVIIIPVLAFFNENLSVESILLSIASIFLVSMLLLALGGVLSVVSIRFGDLPQAITAIIGLAFLVTPVLWNTKVLESKRSFIVDANIFHHMILVMRAPLLGEEISAISWIILIGATFFCSMICYFYVKNFRKSYMPWL